MKKLLLFGLGVIASLSTLTSCKKEEVAIASPTVTFLDNKSSYDAIKTDTSHTLIADVEAAGELDNIKIIDVSDSGSEKQVLSITKFDTDTKHAVKYVITNLKNVTRPIKLKITVTDKKTNVTSETFTLNPFVSINTYTATFLGSQYASTGSFFSTTNGQVFTVNTSASNSQLIDLIYYYSGGNGATIGAADDALISPVYTGIANWSTKNKTRFTTPSPSITTSEFDAILNDTKIDAIPTISETKIIGLAVDNVFAFKTEAGKKGLVKITKLTKGLNTKTQEQDFQFGTIEIVVKVQK